MPFFSQPQRLLPFCMTHLVFHRTKGPQAYLWDSFPVYPSPLWSFTMQTKPQSHLNPYRLWSLLPELTETMIFSSFSCLNAAPKMPPGRKPEGWQGSLSLFLFSLGYQSYIGFHPVSHSSFLVVYGKTANLVPVIFIMSGVKSPF